MLTTRSARHGRRSRSSARRSTYRRRPRSIARLVAGAIVAVAVAVVVVAGGSAFLLVSSGSPDRVLTERVTRELPATAEPQTPTAEPVPAAEPVAAAVPVSVPVSVLSDSHAYFAASWWRQTVEAGAIEGVSMGAFASQPGAVAATIASGLDEAAAASQGGKHANLTGASLQANEVLVQLPALLVG